MCQLITLFSCRIIKCKNFIKWKSVALILMNLLLCFTFNKSFAKSNILNQSIIPYTIYMSQVVLKNDGLLGCHHLKLHCPFCFFSVFPSLSFSVMMKTFEQQKKMFVFILCMKKFWHFYLGISLEWIVKLLHLSTVFSSYMADRLSIHAFGTNKPVSTTT